MDLRRYQPLRDAGATWRKIADEVALHWRMVKRYLSADAPGGPAASRKGTVDRKIDTWLAGDARLKANVILLEHGVSSTTDASAGRARIDARTLRTDRWWLAPLVQATVLTVPLSYVVVRLFMRDWYYVDQYNYLTPLYSPCISSACSPGSAHFGTIFGDLPAWIPLPIIVFPILLGFRGTCYYYRKAVYRSILQSPTACSVREPARRYKGESRFPFLVMNGHRYFLYAASALLLINTYDAVQAFFPLSGGVGIGLGTLIIVANMTLLWLYTLSCHSCRHLLGGRLKHFSRNPVRYRVWSSLSKLNSRHMQFALASLLSVTLTDAYIMSVSAGWISDLRLYN